MVFVIEVFVYPQAWAEHLMWASMLVLLLTRGPGVFSLDHLIERHFAKAD
jgi:putative oxidoreductase